MIGAKVQPLRSCIWDSVRSAFLHHAFKGVSKNLDTLEGQRSFRFGEKNRMPVGRVLRIWYTVCLMVHAHCCRSCFIIYVCYIEAT